MPPFWVKHTNLYTQLLITRLNMSLEFKFTALGKPIDVHFNNTGNHQHLVIYFDGREISDQYGDILNYPDSYISMPLAAANKWEKKQLRLIAEETIAAFIELAIFVRGEFKETCELDSLNQ